MSGNPSSTVLLKLQTLLPTLSKAERKVANYTLKHPEEVISLAVSGLAESSGVSDATVVRACRSMGFDSYQEFKLTLAQSLVSPTEAIQESLSPDDSTEDIIAKVFANETAALELTRDTVQASEIERAAEAIMNAEKVYIFGLGNSHAIAFDLQHKLMRLGIDASAVSDSHIQAISATNCTKKDVVFAISHSGSSVDIVSNSKIAKQHHATIISLTNIGTSPLTKISDITLHTASNETRYRIVAIASRLAQMAIIDTIYTIIAMRSKEAPERFHKIEKALETKKF